jgi:hypothetical protein
VSVVFAAPAGNVAKLASPASDERKFLRFKRIRHVSMFVIGPDLIVIAVIRFRLGTSLSKAKSRVNQWPINFLQSLITAQQVESGMEQTNDYFVFAGVAFFAPVDTGRQVLFTRKHGFTTESALW